MDYSSRLKEIRSFLKLSQQAFADSIGEKQGKIRDIETGKQNIMVDFAKKIEKIHNIDLRWLLTGEGAMFLNEGVSNEDVFNIPTYDINASAGYGCYINDDQVSGYMPFPKRYIKETLAAFPKDLSILTVSGDSMLPTLANNDLILIDNSKATINKEGIYILRIDDTLSVKRVLKLGYSKIKVKSDNPLYDEFIVDLNDSASNLTVLAKVILYIRRFY